MTGRHTLLVVSTRCRASLAVGSSQVAELPKLRVATHSTPPACSIVPKSNFVATTALKNNVHVRRNEILINL